MSTLARLIIDGSDRIVTVPPVSNNPRIGASEKTEEGCKSAATAVPALYDEFMPNIGPLELVIVLVIVLPIFGAKRLPGLGKSLGSGMREFKDSVTGKTKEEEREQLEAESRAHGEAEASKP